MDQQEPTNVLEAFYRKLAETPKARLLHFEGQWMTYQQLDEASSAICGQVKSLGLTKGQMVGFYVDRCLEMPAIILGILKAGAVCVPLDVSYPIEQLRSMKKKVDLEVILTLARLRSEAEKLSSQSIVADVNFLPDSGENIEPDDAAYVLFTSGTSGEPKAVLKNHRSIVRPLLSWLNKETSAASEYRMLLRAPITHSPFMWEFFYPLVSGIELIIASQESLYDMRILMQLVKKYEVSHLCLSPAHLQAFVKMADFSQLDFLVEVDCSGEALPQEVIREFKLKSNADLISTYGCTEVPSATSHYCSELDDTKIIYLGKKSQNVDVYLLDSEKSQVGKGQVGEIYLSSNSMIDGYLNDPEETALRFQDILLAGEYRRCFRTGDLARQLTSGEFEFLGRNDRQIQIRGFRIEPQEIEIAINQYTDSQECLVMGVKMQNGQRVLVAYVVSESLETKSLRKFLLNFLPTYKVPAIFIPIAKIPRNRHHKIAYDQLEDPQEFLLRQQPSIKEDLTATEKVLMDIWTEVLEVKIHSIEQDFFALGGDSLNAMDMLVEVEKRLGASFDLDILGRGSNIKEMAAILDCREVVSQGASPRSKVFFMLHAGYSVTVMQEYLGEDCIVHALGHIAQDGFESRLTSIEEMVAVYIEEIKKVQSHGPYYIGAYCSGCAFAMEIAFQLMQQGEELRQLILIEPAKSLSKPVKSWSKSVKKSNLKKIPTSTRLLTWLKGKLVKFRKISLYIKVKSLLFGRYLRYIYQRIFIAIYMKFSLRLPVRLRGIYIHDILYPKALMTHKTKVYTGNLTIILAKQGIYSNEKSLEYLSSLEVDFRIVENCNHERILKGRQLQDWVLYIKSKLT